MTVGQGCRTSVEWHACLTRVSQANAGGRSAVLLQLHLDMEHQTCLYHSGCTCLTCMLLVQFLARNGFYIIIDNHSEDKTVKNAPTQWVNYYAQVRSAAGSNCLHCWLSARGTAACLHCSNGF